MESFIVSPFSRDNLADALSNKLTSAEKVKERTPFKYFSEYLGDVDDGLNAKTIVQELKYVSKSYLIDFSNYYSTCFKEYDRFCKRVHFFAAEFTEQQFEEAIINNGDVNPIWDSYLGYIVVKPLPVRIIGATLLKTYQHTSLNKRIFTSSKPYTVNVFGKELTIESLAFQEQDSVVGACASSALWSAFHKTSQLFQTALPSPSDITKSAKNLFLNSGRTYPNTGLDDYQVGNAIESVGLVSELRNKEFPSPAYLKAFIYSYNRMGLPILLGIRFTGLGDHLITITGYKDENGLPFPRKPDLSLKASKLERFYAHDDQIGPFSRLSILSDGKIETSWDNETGAGKRIAEFVSLSVPINHKIRLTFENIYAKMAWVDFYFYKSPTLQHVEIYWDIYLDFSNHYKKELREKVNGDVKLKYKLLTEPLPKYVWVAKGYVNQECVIEFLFDATQIANADYCLFINIYNYSLRPLIKSDLENSTIADLFKNNLGQDFLNLLTEACIEST